MRVDIIVRDVRRTTEQIVRGLANGLTANENFGGQGIAGQVLISTGPNTPPVWTDIGDVEIVPGVTVDQFIERVQALEATL